LDSAELRKILTAVLSRLASNHGIQLLYTRPYVTIYKPKTSFPPKTSPSTPSPSKTSPFTPSPPKPTDIYPIPPELNISVGDNVRIHSLTQGEFNGNVGVVLGGTQNGDRLVIEVNDRVLNIRTINLEPLNPPATPCNLANLSNGPIHIGKKYIFCKSKDHKYNNKLVQVIAKEGTKYQITWPGGPEFITVDGSDLWTINSHERAPQPPTPPPQPTPSPASPPQAGPGELSTDEYKQRILSQTLAKDYQKLTTLKDTRKQFYSELTKLEYMLNLSREQIKDPKIRNKRIQQLLFKFHTDRNSDPDAMTIFQKLNELKQWDSLTNLTSSSMEGGSRKKQKNKNKKTKKTKNKTKKTRTKKY